MPVDIDELERRLKANEVEHKEFPQYIPLPHTKYESLCVFMADNATAILRELRASRELAKAMRQISLPDGNDECSTVRNDERLVVCPQSSVQWRMDFAEKALTAHESATKEPT